MASREDVQGSALAVDGRQVTLHAVHRQGAPIVADPAADAFPLCAAADDVRSACAGLVDDLHRDGELPSVYLLIDGRLRCQASRGYFQVSDGFTPSTGVIGRVVSYGRGEVVDDVTRDPTFIAAIPGLRAEACLPLTVFGRVVGAVNLESRAALTPAAVARVERAAAFLGRRLADLGGLPEASLAERLARIAVELAEQTSRDQVRRRAVEGALEISSMSTAAIAHLAGDGWAVRYAAGPLAAVIQSWDDQVLTMVARWVWAGTSSSFPDGEDVPAGYEFLPPEIHALSVQPLVIAGQVAGLLLTADTRPAAHDPAVTSALELLAIQTAAMLKMLVTMESLASQALHDPLTGLWNRRRLMESLPAATDSEGAGAALVLLDLDGFKAVNDRFGHAEGDALLCEVARRLTSAARTADLVCRLGGDEFAVLVHGVDSPAEAVATGQRFVVAVTQPYGRSGGPAVGASAGVRLISGDSLRDVLVDADVALYVAKGAGRGRTVVWDAALRQEELEQESLVRDLAYALANEALTLDYQPVVDIATLRVRGLEALARWHHPARGQVPPSVFVRLAERAGLIRDLTRWVLRTAFAEAASWPGTAQGEQMNVAVNISAAQLTDKLVVQDVRGALIATGLPAGRVVLEVTETAEVVDFALAKVTLDALADLGVGLALDDFGTGYSSLTYAQVLPFDVLKIDRSFVAASASGDRRAIATIAAICALAARLEVDVVAEGVEDQEQLAELIALGCDYAQGYALARPLAQPELARALALHGQAGWVLARRELATSAP